MRVEEGSFRSKQDQGGGHYHLHRLADGPRLDADVPPPPGPEAKRADADTLHEVYSALLARLALGKSHGNALHRRGLGDDAIDRGGYRTLPAQGRPRIVRDLHERFGDKLLRVPGFVVKEGQPGRYLTLRGPAGLLVPCRDRAGRILALKARRDDAGQGGPRYVYVSSAGHGGPGPGAPVHVPLGTPEAPELVRLTEGELKADVVQARTGLPTVSLPGVSNWRPALAVLKALGCQALRLAFDADAWDNAVVARALSRCADALAEAGFTVELERWDAADGKGLDDLLAAGKEPELLRGDAALQAVRDILAAANADEEPAPPAELDRLQDVLAAGGAEALFRDNALMQALADLASADPAGFAGVRASIRGRVSVRDLDRALRPFRRLTPPGESAESLLYFEQSGCIYRNVQTKDGPVPVPLCNFSARIVEVVTRDDGAERAAVFGIEGHRADGRPLPRAEVLAQEFPRLDWVTPAWQGEAVIYAGQGTRDHLRAALELLSPDRTRRTEFLHTGWRQVGEDWYYLHAGGAIGAEGLAVDIDVSLPDALAGFELPAPPTRKELAAAIRTSMGVLDGLAPDRIAFPLLAGVYRAALGDCDFSGHLAGPTGVFKSELAALCQQHFGASLDARHLPGSWSSTGNALEGVAFAAKDAVLIVDDFAPSGSTHDVQRFHREADRILRAQGNRAGRLRMRADTSLRPAKPPRGLILSTGEDTPRGQSLRSRLLVIEVSPGEVKAERLTECQRDAAAGLYAGSLAGFLRWVAPQYTAVRGRLRREQAVLRETVKADGQHARTPGIVADLALGLRYLLDFAQSVGAISETERAELWQRGWRALGEAAAAQAAHIATAEPTALFLRLLSAALASGRAHIANPKGNPPEDPECWGWRLKQIGARENGDSEWQPQGKRIGWLEDGNLYLEPEAAFAEAQRLACEQGESLPVTSPTLRRRLKERGLLVTTDSARGKLTVRKTLQAARRDVLHVAWTGTTSAPQTGPTGPEVEDHAEGGPETRAGSWAGNGAANGEAAQKTAAAGTPGQPLAGVGAEMGRLGQLDTGKEGSAGENNSEQQADRWGEWQ
jgi:hypothetical protein